MIMKAEVSSKAHPEYGQATIPFPIPDSDYDHTIELLEGMGIGSPTAQDCRVDGLDTEYPILNRLVTQSVNVDELDYLATRLSSFCDREDEQFAAMASKLGLSNIRDFINLTFCCQQATVITDFSKLERVGKEHSLTINGGWMPPREYDQVDGHAVALDLIQSGSGVVTPYGVVYDNGMKLEQLYNGRNFPEFYLGPQQLIIEINSGLHGETSGFLYLPCPSKRISRTLERAGTGPEGLQMKIVMDELPPQVSAAVSLTCDGLEDLNGLCRAVEPLCIAERKKLDAVVQLAQPQYANEVSKQGGNLCWLCRIAFGGGMW